MALKKNVRKDNTYMISTDSTDNPKLGAKILLDGRESLFLEYYYGYEMRISEKTGKSVPKAIRKRKSLHRYLHHNPKGPEIQENKDILALAKKIRHEKEQALLENKDGFRLNQNQDINFFDYCQDYIRNYTKKDRRNVSLAVSRFETFIQSTPKYEMFTKTIKPSQITKEMVVAFTDYLQQRSIGEGAASIYKRFKKICKNLLENGIIRNNPCQGISIKVDYSILNKDVLSVDEIKKLAGTHYPNELKIVKKFFFFCYYSAMRYCDAKCLTYANVDFANRRLRFEQNKTKGHSNNSGVNIYLSDNLLKLIGKPQDESNRDELIFKTLPSYGTCLNHVKKWVKAAKIPKNIALHTPRRSLASNLVSENNTNPHVLAAILGHSSLRYVLRYVRISDQSIKNAMESLEEIDISNI